MSRLPTPLVHKGLPVPGIAAWSAEVVPQPLIITALDGIAFEGESSAAGHALGRDTAGVLWRRWALRQGDGTTDFFTVHGPRQKRAMRKHLCQVCGGPSDENQQGRLYLLEDYRGVEGWPEREVTTHPPLCRPCVPLAVRLCPHLRNKVVAVRARRVSIDGVYGMVYQRTQGIIPVATEKRVVFNDDWRVKWTLGAQLAATLTDVTVVDLDELVAGRTAREAASA